MNIFALISARIGDALGALYPDQSDVLAMMERVSVEPPRDPAHGDISSNVAMLMAKPLGMNPRQLATELAGVLAKDVDILSAEVAGPGFLNLRLANSVWQKLVSEVLAQQQDYGKTDLGHGGKVNVEYVSANPTGPMHVGHTRGAVYGDALAALLAYCGYDVTREYYMNDAGAQIDTVARSVFLRYREALGEKIGDIPAGLYPGDYLVPVGQALADEFGDSLIAKPDDEWLPLVKDRVLIAMMDLIRSDLADLGIKHDFFFSERVLHGEDGKIAETLSWLRDEGLIYQGRLEPPKGKQPEDWEDREQTLFRAKKFGDDTDRPLVKSDGSYSYFAADIAYHRDKVLRGFTDQIIVLGADHSGYAKRLQAAVKAVSDGKASIDVKLCQLVRLLRDGEPVKMSKRSGELVSLADVVEEVGADATRFLLLFRRNDASMDFDFARVKEQTRDNPVFYVQYAHARARSAMRAAKRDLPDLDVSEEALKAADLSLLQAPEDIELLRVLAQWPRLVASAAEAHEPHRIAFYVHDLASAFHALWAKGNQNVELRFVNDKEPTLTVARLAMVEAVRVVIANGLELLGVSSPEELS